MMMMCVSCVSQCFTLLPLMSVWPQDIINNLEPRAAGELDDDDLMLDADLLEDDFYGERTLTHTQTHTQRQETLSNPSYPTQNLHLSGRSFTGHGD